MMKRKRKTMAVTSSKKKKKKMTTTHVNNIWSGLVEDLLNLIKKRLSLPDLISFSCVCSSWRSASAAEIRHKGPLPWLLETDQNNCVDGIVYFFSFVNGVTYKVEIPELCNRRIVGASHRWLLTSSSSEMQLLHPFTRKVRHLPPPYVPRIPYVHGVTNRVYKALTSADEPLMVVCILWELPNIYFCGQGDHSWRKIYCRNDFYCDIAFYNGELYAVRNSGEVEVVIGLDTQFPTVELACESTTKDSSVVHYTRYYLVPSSTELLLVVRFYTYHIYPMSPNPTKRFKVFELFGNGRKRIVRNLGDRALFVGFNDSYSVVASELHGCRGNCIYFSRDTFNYEFTGHDNGVYSLENGTIEQIRAIDPKYICPRPLWYAANPC